MTPVPLAFGSYSETNQTDETGTTSLSLPEGNYSATASAAGYVPSSGVIVDIVPGPNPLLTILLEPVPPPTSTSSSSLRARAIRSAGRASSFPGVLAGVANTLGFYNATNITPGTYLLEVAAPGYLTNSTQLTLVSYENLTLTVNLTLAPLILGSAGGGWAFNLFPGSLDELWPFLLVPLILVVGGFIVASLLRGAREEDPAAVPGPVEPGSGAGGDVADRPAESSPGPRT